MTTADDIIHFWFLEIDPKLWFKKDLNFDKTLRSKFSEVHARASKAETFEWRKTALGRLAEILILDQFSRNMFRDKTESFEYDSLALALAQEAVHANADNDLSQKQKVFLYMPYMHSESLLIHEQALKLFAQPGLEDNLDFEKRHLEILKQFGRYPHRNKILDRTSTPEEIEFLKKPGSGF